MLLKHGASAVVQSKVDEITLGILSKKTGEAITLDELLLKDGNTFITAFTTAFVMNSGKAIIVELKGQKYELKPEDLENCIDDDGNFDSEKLEKYLYSTKKRVNLRSDNYKIEDTLNDSIDVFSSFIKNNKNEKYLPTIEEMNKAFDEIEICDSNDEFNRLLKASDDDETVDLVPGFNRKGKIYLRNDVHSQVVVHEVNHTLGNVHGTTSEGISSVGINEAFTDAVTNKIVGVVGNTKYRCGAEAITDINEVCKSFINGDVMLESYYSENKSGFKTLVNTIADDQKFYDNLAEQMNIVIDDNSTYTQQEDAKDTISTMVNEFIYKAKTYDTN